jgi:hypothetical protein
MSVDSYSRFLERCTATEPEIALRSASVPCDPRARGPCHSGCGIGPHIGRRGGHSPALVCRIWTESNF